MNNKLQKLGDKRKARKTIKNNDNEEKNTRELKFV